MSDLIGASRILAENVGSVPVFLDPPRLDGGSRARLQHNTHHIILYISSVKRVKGRECLALLQYGLKDLNSVAEAAA